MNIAILTPSRQRPGKLDRLIDSVYETASKKNSIRMYNYIDTDDPRMVQYKNNEEQKTHHVINVYDKPQSVSKSWNVLAEKAMYESKEWGADVLIMGNDDQIYLTKDWDIKLQDLSHIAINLTKNVISNFLVIKLFETYIYAK